MARITLEELYRGEGAGAKYGGIMNRAAAELLTQGHPAGYDEQTWLELQLIRHTLLIEERMRIPSKPSPHARWRISWATARPRSRRCTT